MDHDPGEIYHEFTREFGEPLYDRVEATATSDQADHPRRILKEAQTIVNELRRRPRSSRGFGQRKI